MTDAANRSVISLEMDVSSLDADIVAGDAIITEFAARMQAATNIVPRIDVAQINGVARNIIRLDVDPNTTIAGLEVIRGIVREYTGRLNREAHINVGVDTRQLHTTMQRVGQIVSTNVKAIGAAFVFDISRGIKNLILDSFRAIPQFLSASLTAFRESEEATKHLTKALAATGEQSGKTRDELQAQASALEEVTNKTDEAIMGLQSLLLASEGLKGINFDRALTGALDLAEAIGGDAAGHAERLGKALQDPVRGMKMLRDSGLSFSDSQKDMIKLFVETGDIVSAQNIILDELESRYGGTSVATDDWNDRLERLGVRLDNMKENIGEVVASGLDPFGPAMERAVDAVDAWSPPLLASVTVLAELAVELSKNIELTDGLNRSAEENVNTVSSWVTGIKATAGSFNSFREALHLTTVEWMKYFLAIDEEDNSPLNDYANTLKDRLVKRASEVEEASIAAREQRKIQAKLDSDQRKAEWDEKQKQRDIELARGSGLVTEDEIAKKGPKQALLDAKLRKAEEKKIKQDELAAKKALADAARAQAKLERETEAADAANARAWKRDETARASEAAKQAREAKKADMAADKALEKSFGRESLVGMHDRIQDSLLGMSGEETEADKLRRERRENAIKPKKKPPAFAPEFVAENPGVMGVEVQPGDTRFQTDDFGVTRSAPAGEGSEFGRGYTRDNTEKRVEANSFEGDTRFRQNDGLEFAVESNPMPAPTRWDHWGKRIPEEGGNASTVRSTDTPKIEVKQDQVVEAITKQTKAIVDAVKEPQKMGK